MKNLVVSLRMLAVLTLVTGGLYPLGVWAIGQSWFRPAAEGSLLVRDGRVIGSRLLAQPTLSPRYFQPRPSAANYATMPSAASNQAWTSAALASEVAARRARWGGGHVPADLLTASGSGLDPDLSPAGIRTQLDRVANARHLDPAQRAVLDEVVARLTRGGQFSPPRINVLQLNLALDRAFPTR